MLLQSWQAFQREMQVLRKAMGEKIFTLLEKLKLNF